MHPSICLCICYCLVLFLLCCSVNPSDATRESTDASQNGESYTSPVKEEPGAEGRKQGVVEEEVIKLHDITLSSVYSILGEETVSKIARVLEKNLDFFSLSSSSSTAIEELEKSCFLLANTILYASRSPATSGLSPAITNRLNVTKASQIFQTLLSFKLAKRKNGEEYGKDVASVYIGLTTALAAEGRSAEAVGVISEGALLFPNDAEFFETGEELNSIRYGDIISSNKNLKGDNNPERDKVVRLLLHDLSQSIMLRQKELDTLMATTKNSEVEIEQRREDDSVVSADFTSLSSSSSSSSSSDLVTIKKIRGKLSHAYSIRGYMMNKENFLVAGCKDFNKALDIEPDSAVLLNFVGRCYRDFGEGEKAVEFYSRALAIEPNWQTRADIVLCYIELAKEREVLEEASGFIKLIRRDMREKGLTESTLDKSIRTQVALIYAYKGLMLQGTGMHEKSLKYFKEAYRFNPSDSKSLYLMAESYATLGRFRESIEELEKFIVVKPENHMAYYKKELCFYYIHRMETSSFESFNLDLDLDPQLKLVLGKEFITEENSTRSYPGVEGGDGRSYSAIYAVDKMQEEGSASSFLSFLVEEDEVRIKQVIFETQNLSLLLQLNSPGFVRNRRQHRQFSFAVLHSAQRLHLHISCLTRQHSNDYDGGRGDASNINNNNNNRFCDSSGGGLLVPSVSSNSFPPPPSTTTTTTTTTTSSSTAAATAFLSSHAFSWRDFFDIIFKWRQISDFKDVVFWLDHLPGVLSSERSQRTGYGLDTPLISGVKKILRYYSYYERAFEITKRSLLRNGYYDEQENLIPLTNLSVRGDIQSAQTLDQLMEALKLKRRRRGDSEDTTPHRIFVNLEIESKVFPGKKLNGTRINIATNDREGYEFSVCFTHSQESFLLYGKELNFIFTKITQHLANLRIGFLNDEQRKKKKEDIVVLGLEMFYFWANFSPITRGTSAIGYAALVSIITSVEESILFQLPFKIQLDFEAFFSETADEFVLRVLPMIANRSTTSSLSSDWLYLATTEFDSSNTTDLESATEFNVNAQFSMSDIFKTLKHVYFALNSAIGL